MNLNKDELCKRCIHKQYCKMEKDTCDKCGKKVSEFYPFSFFGYGDSCYCKECSEKFCPMEVPALLMLGTYVNHEYFLFDSLNYEIEV